MEETWKGGVGWHEAATTGEGGIGRAMRRCCEVGEGVAVNRAPDRYR